MDPGDQLYTLDELSCWKVENLRQLLTMRGLTKSGTKEELAVGMTHDAILTSDLDI